MTVRAPPAPAAPAVEIGINLASDAGVERALAEVRERFGARIASVIHLAAYYDVSGPPNPLYDEVTVRGTRRLIDALQPFEIEQFVFASTMLIHQPTDSPEKRIAEESPVAPRWPYPESKVRTELLLRERHGRIPVVFLRIAGVYEDEGRSPYLAEQIARIHEHRLRHSTLRPPSCPGASSSRRMKRSFANAKPVLFLSVLSRPRPGLAGAARLRA